MSARDLRKINAGAEQDNRAFSAPDLSLLVNNMPSFVYRCLNDYYWTMVFISAGCRNVTGYAPHELVQNASLSFGDIIHSEDRRWEQWQERLRTVGHIDDEYRIIAASGEERWVWDRGQGVFDDQGQLIYIDGFVMDITHSKKAELALLAQEEQYRQLFNLSPVAIAILDFKGTFIDVNLAYCRHIGYTKDELIGANVRLCVLTENLPLVEQNIAAMKAGATLDHEVRCLRKDGSIRVTALREKAVPLFGGGQGILSLATDITEMKHTQEALQHSEKKYRSLVENMLEGMFIFNADGQLLFWNRAGLKIAGFDASKEHKLFMASIFNLVHPNSADKVRQDLQAVWQGQSVMGEYQYRRPSGVVGWYEAYSTRINYEGTDAALVLVRDISERKKEQSDLEFLSWYDPLTYAHNRRYFEKLLSQNDFPNPGVVVVDLDGLKLANDAFGHAAGDTLLKEAANILKLCTPPGAVTARIGGDEFVLILPNTNDEQAETVMNSIRGLQDAYNSKHPPFPLSLSVGYQASSPQAPTLYEIFRQADNLMYKQKLLHRLSRRSTIVQSLMAALEAKNVETREHVERLGELTILLARRIGYPESKLDDLGLFAKFHDIGKVGVADSILNKPGRLTPDERKEIERHSEIGFHIANATPELNHIAKFILQHHEWYDGSGYPLGLKGEEIPLECRMVSIVDAYDAMTSDRPYRKAMTNVSAIRELKLCAGTQFDRKLVEVFVSVIT